MNNHIFYLIIIMLKYYCTPFIIILLLITAENTHSQTFNKFGLKGGFSVSGLSTFNPKTPSTIYGTNLYIYDKSDYFNFFSFAIGVFTEWFNSEEFCLSAELHYSVKGETDKTIYTVPDPNHLNIGNEWENGMLNDKAYFVSLQMLPRYRVGISEKGEDNVYIFAGPTFNFLVSNKSTYSQPDYIKNKGPLGDIGGAFGIGFESNKTYSFEIKLDYNLTGSYDFKYENDVVTRRYNSISVVTGIAFSELFKK